MKVFISMGMKSKSTEQVRVEMQKVFEKVKEKLPEACLVDSIVNGADKDIALKGDDAGVWYLGESIKRMSEADIVFFINDWKNYRGCKAERMVASAYKKLCVDMDVTL